MIFFLKIIFEIITIFVVTLAHCRPNYYLFMHTPKIRVKFRQNFDKNKFQKITNYHNNEQDPFLILKNNMSRTRPTCRATASS